MTDAARSGLAPNFRGGPCSGVADVWLGILLDHMTALNDARRSRSSDVTGSVPGAGNAEAFADTNRCWPGPHAHLCDIAPMAGCCLYPRTAAERKTAGPS